MEKELAFVNVDNLYSSVSYASLWGISGVGNLFKPGTLTGSLPTYSAISGSVPYHPGAVWSSVLDQPGLSIAQRARSCWKYLTGGHDGASVFRGGYAIATVREGMAVYQSLVR